MSAFVRELVQSIREHGAKVCAVDLSSTASCHDRSMTYDELLTEASMLAGELMVRFHRAKSGDRRVIGIVARNSCSWVVADLACLLSGSTALPLPLAFSRAQAEHLAAHCDGFLIDGAGQQTLQDKWQLPIDADQALHLDSVISSQRAVPSPALDDDWTCKVIHTSGTTSRPKGVQITTGALGAVLESLRKTIPSGTHRKYLSVVPLSLLLEQVTALYLPLLSGGTVFFLPEDTALLGEPGASPDKLIDWLVQVKPTAMTVPPVIVDRFSALFDSSADLRAYLTDNVHITCGGATVGADAMNRLAERCVPVYQGYGLSENTSVVSMNTRQDQRIGSVGKPLSHVNVRIATDGTIEIKSASLFSGYSGSDPSACSLGPDGWLDTGDLGSLDQDGFLYVHGRKKNVICLPNGRNVSPEQVEADLQEYAGIAQAAVFHDPVDGLIALLVTATAVDRNAMEAWCRARFSEIERPQRFWLVDHADPCLSTLFTITGRPKRDEIAAAYPSRSGHRQPA